MKIFITGASGFVGGAVARHLSSKHDIIAMSRSDRSDATIHETGATPVRTELNAVTPEMLDGVDAIIHCAAFVEEWGPIKAFEKLNVEGTRQLLDVANQVGVRRFVHISTEAALFHGQHMRDIDETYPLSLNSPYPYSRTKAQAEKLVREFEGSVETIVIRPRMIWGEGDQTILPTVKAMNDAGKFMWIDGGDAMTSSTNIRNLVHGIELALTNGVPGSAYFVVDGPAMRFRDFMEAYAVTDGVKLAEKSMPGWLVRGMAWISEGIWRIFRIKSPPPITRFTANIMSRDCTINDDLARKELGYQPLVNVSEGLALLTKS